MSINSAPSMPSVGRIFTKDTIENGKPSQIECIQIGGQTFSISQGLLTVVRLEDEWYEDLNEPEKVIEAIKASSDFKADLFTFWQRMPDVEPRYPYHQGWEYIAMLPVTSYNHWWAQQIKPKVRNLIRKSEKVGVVVKETAYDDDFVHGMTAIFNEAPVRQGRKFWHYGKEFETIKSQFSRYLFREHMIGAYYQGEMIGFMMLGDAGRFGLTGQIISMLKHRDKSVNNALIAEAVKVCEARKLAHLVYYFWSDDSLGEFKRHCGFQKVRVPRYYVTQTLKGKLALKCGLHRGWRQMLPEEVRKPLKQLRRNWNEFSSR
jgi:hypothetical protein